MIVEQHPEDPQSAILAVAKSNIGPIPPAISFQKVPASIFADDGEVINTSRLLWTGCVEISADELLRAREEGRTSDRRDAADFLHEVLAAGRVERTQVTKAAKRAGISERNLDRISNRLGVIKKSEGFGAEKRSYWSLPDEARRPPESPFQPIHALTEFGENGRAGGNGVYRSLVEPGSLAERQLLDRIERER